MRFLDTIRASLGSGMGSANGAPPAAVPPEPLPIIPPRPTVRTVRARFFAADDRGSQVRRDSVEERELRSRNAMASATLYTTVPPAAPDSEGNRQRIALPAGLSRAALERAAEQHLSRELVNGRARP
jgi:hypothetical protein